ncbi:hypothetical protein F0562_007208 [Nyssa sinensis]|uniref:ENT domain-containing protein n=1 Tax=Nyssa sinensis TaxID=561372 RepID=A0A5J5A5D1_9ASTE|nr:hypothetical protein F0562_007208 [Nyssa sinensis]
MRFKKGSKVEAMIGKEVPISWRSAEIISGNGHTYSVRFWVESYYLVRVLGFSQEFKVHKFNIRVRQSWEDEKWVVIGKGSGSCKGVKHNKLSTSNCYKKASLQVRQDNTKSKLQAGDDCFAVQNNAGLQESHIVTSRTLKRPSPYCSSIIEACTGDIMKVRAIDKQGRRQRVFTSSSLEKVDAVAYPRENLGEKYMHSSFNNRSHGYYEMERAKQNGVVGHSLARSAEPNDSDSDACSVGSCSVISKSPNKFSGCFITVPCQDTYTLCGDAESFYCSGDKEENRSLPLQEEVGASIHRLELHAYHRTLEALYASGPLSWEQEALLTNLRITLHISNDEHLMELRSLISTGTGPELEACIPCFQRSKDDAGVSCELQSFLLLKEVKLELEISCHENPDMEVSFPFSLKHLGTMGSRWIQF